MRRRMTNAALTGATTRGRTGWLTSAASITPPRQRRGTSGRSRPTRMTRVDRGPRRACAGRGRRTSGRSTGSRTGATSPIRTTGSPPAGWVHPGLRQPDASMPRIEVIVADRLVTAPADDRAWQPLVDDIRDHRPAAEHHHVQQRGRPGAHLLNRLVGLAGTGRGTAPLRAASCDATRCRRASSVLWETAAIEAVLLNSAGRRPPRSGWHRALLPRGLPEPRYINAITRLHREKIQFRRTRPLMALWPLT